MEEEGEGLPVHEICTSTQIRRRAFYNWWNRYRLSGSEGLNLKEYSTQSTEPHQKFKDGTAENVIWLLDHAIHEYAKPQEILTDHGSQFWSVRRGESSFDTFCERNKIKHILGGIGKPTTLRKIDQEDL